MPSPRRASAHWRRKTAGAHAVEQPLRPVGLQPTGELVGEGGGIGGAAEGFGGVVADGDVVGVAVEPVGAEGQHHLGAEAAHLQHQAFHHLARASFDECPGVIVGLPALHPRVAVSPDIVAVQAQGAHGAG